MIVCHKKILRIILKHFSLFSKENFNKADFTPHLISSKGHSSQVKDEPITIKITPTSSNQFTNSTPIKDSPSPDILSRTNMKSISKILCNDSEQCGKTISQVSNSTEKTSQNEVTTRNSLNTLANKLRNILNAETMVRETGSINNKTVINCDRRSKSNFFC